MVNSSLMIARVCLLIDFASDKGKSNFKGLFNRLHLVLSTLSVDKFVE